MNKINQLTIMFATYWNSGVQYTYGHPNENINNELSSDVKNAINNLKNIRYKDFKLILIPLSDITDNHALEVANILENDIVLEWGEELAIEMAKKIVNDMFKFPIRHLEKYIYLLDYLRSKSYDCGYMNIPSLIQAGYAIKK